MPHSQEPMMRRLGQRSCRCCRADNSEIARCTMNADALRYEERADNVHPSQHCLCEDCKATDFTDGYDGHAGGLDGLSRDILDANKNDRACTVDCA